MWRRFYVASVFCCCLPAERLTLHASYPDCIFYFNKGGFGKRSYVRSNDGGDKPHEAACSVSSSSKVPPLSSRGTAGDFTRTRMSDLLHMIAERPRPLKQTASDSSSSTAVLAELFTSATSSARLSEKQRVGRCRAASENSSVKKTFADSQQKTNVISGLSPIVSPTLVEKLRRNVRCKQIDWQQILCKQQTLQKLSVWRHRSEWVTRFLSSSAVDLNCADNLTDFFCCSAPTGSGKSSLVPLFLLDSHWTRLLQRIDASRVANSGAFSVVDVVLSPSLAPAPFCITGKSSDFLVEFGASSRLCIVVSQPTRLACVELAKFTTSLIASSAESLSTPTGAAHVGGRVGYAVGGDSCFSSASEIIYATPGYIVNALQHGGGALLPTTLVIDETHCRDMQTDLLLAWTKQQLLNEGQNRVRLRQLVLMSATLPVEQMVALVSLQPFLRTTEKVNKEGGDVSVTSPYASSKTLTIVPTILSVEGATPLSKGICVASHSVGTQMNQYRVEKFFIDDLPDAIVNSQVLFGEVKGHSPSIFSAFPLLAPPARRVMTSLAHFFSYTRFVADIHSPQARVLAQFLLFILQTLAISSRSSSEVASEGIGQKWYPESILVFLPGFSEMSLVLQCLESLCKAVSPRSAGGSPQSSPTSKNSVDGTSGSDSGNTINNDSTTFLQFENCFFSVALLHATAIGSLQQQLNNTAGPFHQRIILSTTVAESSVTIPNVRCVVDSCLERSFFTDPLTGVMLRRTTLASASSLLQRGGRTGRTCDGVVFYLAPRRIFHSLERVYNTAVCDVSTPHTHAMDQSVGRGSLSSLVAFAQTPPESVMINPAAVLLSVKYLFPLCAGALVKNLPSPPSPHAISHAMTQLVDLGILHLPAECDSDDMNRSYNDSKNKNWNEFVKEKLTDRQLSEVEINTVLNHYDNARLSAKGEFVAYFPIPHEQALLIYFALQFTCVEEGLLVACAMTVPSLLIAPRITAQGDSTDGGTPAMQYLLSLETQSKLAEAAGKSAEMGESGKRIKGKKTVNESVGEGSFFFLNERNNCYLSEPLMLLSLLREWYACTNNNEVVEFQKKYRVNRSALRLVDTCVAQCAARLYRLITLDSGIDDEKNSVNNNNTNSNNNNNNNNNNTQHCGNELYGEYDSSMRRPSTRAIEKLIAGAFPVEYRRLLAGSLQRLHFCALEHASHRFSERMCTMSHWYPYDEQLLRLLQPLRNQRVRQRKWKGDNNDKSHYCYDDGNAMRSIFGTMQQRLSAAFVAAFARNTMRGEDGAHRVHHKRLLRNNGVLREDVNNICSFNVELQTRQHKTSSNKGAALYERLTAEELNRVLKPYFAGTSLCQLELFSNGKSAVACFGAAKQENMHGENMTSLAEQQCEEPLLAPKVLPFEQITKPSLPTVTLAHIGISLLVSLQTVLTRLTILLPHSDVLKVKNEGTRYNSNIGKPYVHSNNHCETETTNEKPCEKTKLLPASFTRSTQHELHFASVNTGEKENGSGQESLDVCVTWHDSYGVKRSLLLSDVRRIGYDELFPTPYKNALLDAHTIGKTTSYRINHDESDTEVTDDKDGCINSNNSEGLLSPSTDANSFTADLEDNANKVEEDNDNVVLSIHRVAFTNALIWKVTLPTMHSRRGNKLCVFSSSGIEKKEASESYYCWVCHTAWRQKDAFYAHCRSFTHLNRLAFAVQHHMRREWVSLFSSDKISDAFLRTDDNYSVDGGSSVELRHCAVSSMSFLNALQWHPRAEDAAASMPIAIAGSLVVNTTGATGATSLRGNGSALQALHVWVLQTGGADLAPSDTSASLHARLFLPSSLFVLAGYLAAASSGFDAALLTNADHSRAYAVMLYDWAVWQVPAPLTRTQLQSVFDVFLGKPWRGVPFSDPENENGNSINDNNNVNGKERESLHWCVVSGVCPQCTYCGSGCCEENKTKDPEHQLPSSGGKALPVEQAVESTILLILYEYKNSRRSVVSFADYIQRVVAKLNTLSLIHERDQEQPIPGENRLKRRVPSKNEGVLCSGAELLARFVARRHQQPLELLLRDMGCQFLSQPVASAQVASKRSSLVSASVEGITTTTEKLFLIPSVLPSYLPSPNFAAELHRQRKVMKNVVDGEGRTIRVNCDDATVFKKPQQDQPQPSF